MNTKLSIAVIGMLLLVIVAAGSVTSALARGQQTGTIGILISEPTGSTGIHLLPNQNILFLQPSLSDGFLVCTKFENGGFTNCRTVKELRAPK